jgi:hypothetical protein
MAEQFERSPQDVCVQEGAKIADVSVVVDRRTARVKSEATRCVDRGQRFSAVRECVMENERCHSGNVIGIERSD